MGVGDQTGCLSTCHLSESYLDVSRVPYHANCTRPIPHRASTSLNSPLLTCKVHRFMRLSPYPYTSISSIQLQTRLVRPGNVFPVINSPKSVLMGQVRRKALCRAINEGIRVGLQLRKPISMMFH
ncbi:uncharacterized protein TNCV_3958421 [Trichonephila clavipes]|nr:uncharacterized protein TNCV_3958421 [Trichonephila clavipes]